MNRVARGTRPARSSSGSPRSCGWSPRFVSSRCPMRMRRSSCASSARRRSASMGATWSWRGSTARFRLRLPRLSRRARFHRAARRDLDPRGTGGARAVSVDRARASTEGKQLAPGVAAALAAAEIPASKLGPARRARHTDAEREPLLLDPAPLRQERPPEQRTTRRRGGAARGRRRTRARNARARGPHSPRPGRRDRGRLPLLRPSDRAPRALPGERGLVV